MNDFLRETIRFYNDYADSFEEKTKNKQKREWLDRFVAALPAKGEVLDLGCAYGRDLRTFVDLGLSAVGIDGSEVMVGKAQELVPEAKVMVGDVRKLPFNVEQFVGVWASNIFVHLPKSDMPAALKGIADCLVTDGVLYGSLYLGDSEGMEEDSRYENAAKYYSYFTEEEIRKLLSDAGFEIVAFEPRDKDEYERADILEFLAKKMSM